MTSQGAAARRQHILAELGFSIRLVGDELHGRARIVPEMFVPGTDCLRTSILATWADHLAGLLASHAITPRVPVTLELDVHVYEELRGCDEILAAGRTLKAGRSVIVATVEFTSGDGEPVGVGTASFMPAPDTTLTLPPLSESISMMNDRRPTLAVPLAERARCERRARGMAVLPRSDDGMNASNTVNGGLIALLVEEAALSAAAPGATLSSLAMRYLRPVRIGPATALADVHAGLARVEVRDEGSDDRLAVMATTRTFDPSV